jgi:predicted HicB family RNase H-like nuclease
VTVKRKKHGGGRPPLPPEERRESLTVRIPRALAERLRAVAAQLGVSVGRVVEEALREHLP